MRMQVPERKSKISPQTQKWGSNTRTTTQQWLQMGTGLYIGGGVGHKRAEPMLKWKDAIARAKAKGAETSEDIYKSIEESSQKSRASVNKSLEGIDCKNS